MHLADMKTEQRETSGANEPSYSGRSLARTPLATSELFPKLAMGTGDAIFQVVLFVKLIVNKSTRYLYYCLTS